MLNLTSSCGDKRLLELLWKRLSQMQDITISALKDVWESVNATWWANQLADNLHHATNALKNAQDTLKQKFENLQQNQDFGREARV